MSSFTLSTKRGKDRKRRGVLRAVVRSRIELCDWRTRQRSPLFSPSQWSVNGRRSRVDSRERRITQTGPMAPRGIVMTTYTREDLRQAWLNARRAAGFGPANAVLKAWGTGSIEGVKDRDIASCITALNKLVDDPEETVTASNGAGFPTGTRKQPNATGKARTMQDVADKSYGASPSMADHGYTGLDDPRLHKAAWDKFNHWPKDD